MIGKSKKTSIKTPEAVIQKQVESYLRLKRIPYLRIPDAVYRSIKTMGKRGASQTASAVSGFPDLTIFKVLADGSTACLPLELKAKGGRLSEAQKEWKYKIGTQVAYGFEDAVTLIESFWNRSV